MMATAARRMAALAGALGLALVARLRVPSPGCAPSVPNRGVQVQVIRHPRVLLGSSPATRRPTVPRSLARRTASRPLRARRRRVAAVSSRRPNTAGAPREAPPGRRAAPAPRSPHRDGIGGDPAVVVITGTPTARGLEQHVRHPSRSPAGSTRDGSARAVAPGQRGHAPPPRCAGPSDAPRPRSVPPTRPLAAAGPSPISRTSQPGSSPPRAPARRSPSSRSAAPPPGRPVDPLVHSTGAAIRPAAGVWAGTPVAGVAPQALPARGLGRPVCKR
jgi:hypothetical protein